jgi:hypothetical protein
MPSAPPLPRCPVCGFVQQAELKPTADAPAYCGRPSCGVEFLSCDGEQVRLRTFRLVDGYSLSVRSQSGSRQRGGQVGG